MGQMPVMRTYTKPSPKSLSAQPLQINTSHIASRFACSAQRSSQASVAQVSARVPVRHAHICFSNG